jgi:hypothetical protein
LRAPWAEPPTMTTLSASTVSQPADIERCGTRARRPARRPHHRRLCGAVEALQAELQPPFRMPGKEAHSTRLDQPAPRDANTNRGRFDRAPLHGPVDNTSDRDSCTVSNARAKSLSSRQVPLPWCRSAADTIRTERALSGAREGAHPPVSCAPSPAWQNGDRSARSPWIISPLLGCGRQS